MLRNNRGEMFFSQSALGTYQSCQLRFRRRYLEGLYWPGTWALDKEGKDILEQGKLFHLLAQRYYMLGQDPNLNSVISEPIREWIRRLVDFRPLEPGTVFLPEQELRLHTGDLRLVAKYDLLAFKPDGRVLIYDWKTTGTAPKKEYWERHLQTIIYRYGLCAAGEACSPYGKVLPEKVSMLYWNPQFPGNTASMTYSTGQFFKDEEYLKGLIKEIENREYELFLATTDEKRCRHCEYSPICLGERAAEAALEEDDLNLELDWESINEIGFY